MKSSGKDSMHEFETEKEREHHEPAQIVDTRHSRDLDTAQPEPPPAPEESTVVPEPEPEDLDLKKSREGAVPLRAPPPPGPPAAEIPAGEAPAGQEAAPADQESFEMAQIREVFGAGITNYLLGHLNFLLNFAVIYLGRAPNPATGLISPDMEKAKLAIDMLEFIYAHVSKELPAQERTGIERVLADLKLSYMQVLTEAAPPIIPKPTGGNL
jgi:hypothetical protein